jgi:hypothetical protein
MNDNEKLYAIALTRLNYFNLAGLAELYRRLGSATAVVEHRQDIRAVLPNASPRLVEAMKTIDWHLRLAETELEYNARNGIETLCMADSRYPQRLKECDDAPLVLFYKGTANLNAPRGGCGGGGRCTVYGQDLVRRLMQDLRSLCPELLVVSGLAYGVDINAHRCALQSGFPTVGILAHGLDDLYPPRHRPTADEMVKNGGLLTEFLTNTNADKLNFVRRNRIVAGISDACIVIESAAHGGGLITASIANSYGRDVFAFPGAVEAPYSEGCNHLIRDNKAALITSALDFVRAMNWEDELRCRQKGRLAVGRQLFPDLSAEEQRIVATLQKHNDLQINMLSVQAGIPISHLTSLLFQLEMKGVIKMLAGGTYHLLG